MASPDNRSTRFSNLVVKGKELTYATTLTEADSGKTYFLNSSTEFSTTLPIPKRGMCFNFIVKTAPVADPYIIATNSEANIILGQVYTVDVNSATDPDFATTAGNYVQFVPSTAVAGDRVSLISDGTNWYAECFCSVYNAITIDVDASMSPSISPSISPSLSPSFSPSLSPSLSPSISLSVSPSISPSISLSVSPSISPSLSPSISPSISPSPSE